MLVPPLLCGSERIVFAMGDRVPEGVSMIEAMVRSMCASKLVQKSIVRDGRMLLRRYIGLALTHCLASMIACCESMRAMVSSALVMDASFELRMEVM